MVVAAQANVAAKQQAVATAQAAYKKVSAIDAEEAYANGIADPAYASLDALFARARQAQADYEAAVKAAEAAAAEAGKHSERYVAALLNLQDARDALEMAQAAYNEALAVQREQAGAMQRGTDSPEQASGAANPTHVLANASVGEVKQAAGVHVAATTASVNQAASAQKVFSSTLPQTGDAAPIGAAGLLAALSVGVLVRSRRFGRKGE